MKIEKVMTVYKHYTGLWIVLALVRVNGMRQTRRLSFDTEEEARAVVASHVETPTSRDAACSVENITQNS